MPLLIGVGFDEMDRLYSLYFMVILTFLMVGTVFIYMQRPAHRERVAVLLIGILLTITLTMAVPTIYWHNHGGTNIIPAVVAGIVVFLVMFSPALISLLPRSKRLI
jgi:membrane-associated phospholipid phosphatase